MKERSFLVIVFLIVFFSINFVLAEDIDFSYPENVNVGEEFEVELTLLNFPKDLYAVKIEILDGNSNIGQRFWESKWKSTNFWMYDAINTSENKNKKFKLNITKKYEGLNNITVKVRKNSSKKDINKTSYKINISSSEDDDSINNPINNFQSGVYYELEFDEDNIINGGEFNIGVNVFNLKDGKYDIRLWIEDNGKIISERYDVGNDKWKSGIFYINKILEGPGNMTKKIKIRMNEDYKDFIGRGYLFFKIRDESEIKQKIDILDKIKVKEDEKTNVEEDITNEVENNIITGNVIRLGKTYVKKTEDIKSRNNIVYESNTEIVKKYSIYGFTLLCVVMCVLIIWRKLE